MRNVRRMDVGKEYRGCELESTVRLKSDEDSSLASVASVQFRAMLCTGKFIARQVVIRNSRGVRLSIDGDVRQ